MTRSVSRRRTTRRNRGAALLVTLSVLTTLCATGIPALITRSQTRSLQQALTAGGSLDRAMIATLPFGFAEPPPASAPPSQTLDADLGQYISQVPQNLHPEQDQAWDGVHLGTPVQGMAQGTDAQLALEYRSAVSENTHMLSGTMPEAAADPTADSIWFEVALSAATAQRYGAHVGSVIPMSVGKPSITVALRVTGIFEPSDASSAFWTYDHGLQTPAYITLPRTAFWSTEALIGPGELAELENLGELGDPGALSQPLDALVCVPLDTSGYDAQNAGSLTATLTAFESIAVNVDTQTEAQTAAGPLAVLGPFQQQRTSIDSILALVLSGVALISAVTLLLCTRLVISRRRPHFALLRARGQSRLQLARQAFVGLALPNLAANALVAAAVWSVLRAYWTTPGTVLAAVIAAVVWLGPPLLAIADHWAQSSVHADRDDLVRRRRSSRGRVFELLLVVLGIGAVVEVRLQGLGATQQGSNMLGTLAPILLAALATAVAVRCYPLLLRPAARAAERRGGPASFLGLAGAARSALPLAVPAFVVTLTLTLVALGGLMQHAIGSGRVASSWQALGADAVVTLPAATTATAAARALPAIEAVPGVTHATAVATQSDTTANETLVLVDPSSYAAVSADSPWPLGTSLPATASGSGPVPVLVGQNAQEPVGALVAIQPDYAPSFQGKVVGHVAQFPVTSGGTTSGSNLVIVPSWGVTANAADWPPNEILVSGNGIDESAMNAAVHRSLPSASTVAYRADLLTGYVHAPLAQLAEFGYLSGLLIAAAFGVCGILISLSLAAPSRRRRLTLLSTLGLTPRQARAIALAETVPLAAVTVVGGLLAAAALPAAFGDSLNLSVFTGQPGATALAFEPGIPLLAALAAVALTAFGVVVQAAAAGRGSASAMLRMGEDADA